MNVKFQCLFLALALLVGIQQAAGQTSFASAVNYNVGNSPRCVVAADVNSDGKLDLISANFGVNTLTVLTNNGSGSFGSNATLHVGSGPSCVAAADINGDGKLDLISANSGTNTLTVFTNNGSGSYGSNTTLVVGSTPNCVVAADVNSDGKLDLISANAWTYPNSGTLTVLTNNGSGVFGSNATLNVDSGPVSLVAVDINGDGKPDLICANFYSYTLTVFTNNGNGVFGFNATLLNYPGGPNGPLCVVTADVNGDGKPDLITANGGQNTLTVLTNYSSGDFNLDQTIQVNSNPRSVVAADVNGDGKPELFNTSLLGILTVVTNNGDGNFTVDNNTILSVSSTPWSLIAADINGDGRLDLICANSGSSTISVLTNALTFLPSLALKRSNTNVMVSWPSQWTGWAGWTLQQNTNLNATDWTSFSGTIGDDGTTKSTTNSSLMGNLFFRLRHP